VQNAVKWMLSRQQADGTWFSENGILGTHLAANDLGVDLAAPSCSIVSAASTHDVSATFGSNVT